MGALGQAFRYLVRKETRFPESPTWPIDQLLPEGWQDWTGGPFVGADLVIWAAPVEMRMLQCVWSRVTETGVPTDPAVTTHHFLNLTGGNPDATWVDADFTTVEEAFVDFWDVIKVAYTTGTKLDQFRWYVASQEIEEMEPRDNPAVRVVEQDSAGTLTGVNPLPPQVAISVTEKTALRKRWGRFYLPGPSVQSCAPTGTISDGLTTILADAARDFYETCRGADIMPVVFSRQLGAAFEVEKVQVDDLFDVIRSRRWKQPGLKVSHTLT